MVELDEISFSFLAFDDKNRFLGLRSAIIEFSAPWCGPCKVLTPRLEELSRKYQGRVDIYSVDVDAHPDLASRFNIFSIPTMLFIPLSGEYKITVGSVATQAIEDLIQEIL